MAVVARRTISFLCDMLRYAGLDPAPTLRALGFESEHSLPDEVPLDVACRLVAEIVPPPSGDAVAGGAAQRLHAGFLAVLSRELRTPLNGLVGASEQLARSPLNPEQLAMLHEIQASADAMTSVLSDLMALEQSPDRPPRGLIPPPIDDAARESLAPRATMSGAPASLPDDDGARRVLVVDDIAANRVVASRIVERMGFEVDTATNGSEAVEALRRRRYSLVLMDCLMPVMDGYDAARAIREFEEASGRRTPIVAVSASALASDRERCFESGMDDFVEKPVRGASLETVISRWCTPAA